MKYVKPQATYTSKDGQRRITFDRSGKRWQFYMKSLSGAFVEVKVTPTPNTKEEAHKWLKDG